MASLGSNVYILIYFIFVVYLFGANYNEAYNEW